MDKHEIARIFEEIATLLEILGENPFRVNAYRNAGRKIEGIGDELGNLVKEGRLTEIPGVGKDLAQKIETLYASGTHPFYEELKKKVPEGLLDLLTIPGLGPKKIKELYEELGIKSVEELKTACEQGTVSKLAGFGEKSIANILDGIEHRQEYVKSHLWWEAMESARPILDGLGHLKGVEICEVAGSVRRKKETVRDLDLLVVSQDPERIMEWFTSQPWVASVTSKGKTKSSVRLSKGMQADLRVVSKKEYPFALLYFTGSKEHNIRLRQIAKAKGWSLSEYGLEGYRGQLKSEKEIYKALGLACIPPELREDEGEIVAASKAKLPKLVEPEDIRGAFHVHTTASDGHNTLEEMAKAADAKGWEYLGISDHSKSSRQANGLDEERVLAQIDQIKALNRSKKFKTHLFAGIECDILDKGELDFSDDVLQLLDFVIVSIHRGFRQDEKTITKRLIRAIEHPNTTMVGHLTGRLLLQREPYLLDIQKVIDAAIANHKIIEINAHPLRLDMDWRLWHNAKERGLKCSINPDAHHLKDLDFIEAGVNIARKGWLAKEDILNTYPLAKVKTFLRDLTKLCS